MISSGGIMSAGLLIYEIQPHLSLSEKYEFVYNFFRRMCGDLKMGFHNSNFLSERESADINFSLAYFMRESNCFPRLTNLMHTVAHMHASMCV